MSPTKKDKVKTYYNIPGERLRQSKRQHLLADSLHSSYVVALNTYALKSKPDPLRIGLQATQRSMDTCEFCSLKSATTMKPSSHSIGSAWNRSRYWNLRDADHSKCKCKPLPRFLIPASANGAEEMMTIKFYSINHAISLLSEQT